MNVTAARGRATAVMSWLSLLWLAVLAQDAPAQLATTYQHCELEAPAATSTRHDLENNYRFPPGASPRSLSGLGSYRCDAAWTASPAFFDANGVCPFFVSGCSVDSSGNCGDRENDWLTYDVLGARTWSGSFSAASVWPRNPLVQVHSGAQSVEQWTRHQWWAWSFPTRYQYLGVVERPLGTPVGDYPRCYGMAYLIGFFNGVATTRRDAEEALLAMRSDAFIGVTHRGARVRYHLLYNQTGCDRMTWGCLEDVAEVYMQRSAELDGLLERRWEYFWEQVTAQGQSTTSFTQALRTRVLAGAHALGEWLDALGNAMLAKFAELAARMLANPPTLADTASHVAELVAFGQQAFRAVLVGHSQGNLFANAAYDGYLAHSREVGASIGHDTGYVAAQVVHVAPASPTLRGPHVLAEIDLVIEALRRVDGTPVPVNTLGRDVMPASRLDATGHGFITTYLDPERRASSEIRQLVVQALDAL